ncbi:MAG TPA: hypothetical protein VEK80_08080 [Kribbellaceae bacterium]|nr:hypothetical protein [Kribbellaceae bacterium]
MHGGRSATPSEIVGRVIEVDEPYARQQGIGWLVLGPLIILAGVARSIGLLIAAITRSGTTAGGGGRSLKELKRGPELLVTPFLVRPPDGAPVELEVHGHMVSGALVPGDMIVAQIRPQRRRDLPPQAYRIDNYTSQRAHAPHPPTLWTHLGPALLLQAAIGVLIAALLVSAFLIGSR